jgi:hypothetical protein
MITTGDIQTLQETFVTTNSGQILFPMELRICTMSPNARYIRSLTNAEMNPEIYKFFEYFGGFSKDKDQYAIEEDWISWDGKTLNREIPSAVTSKVKSFEYSEIDLLKSGTYTSITRFDKPILKTSNSNCKLNPSRTASMLQVNTFDLKLNNSLIENAITLTP